MSENCLFVGQQLARNPGVEEAVPAPEYNHAARGPLVSLLQFSYNDDINAVCFCSDEPTGRLALVFELMDMNMYEAIKGRRHYLPEQRVKYYMYQVLKAIDHMHRNGIFHRDIKP